MLSSKPKIIHAPLEIAGQVGLICKFLRSSGYRAVGYNYFNTYLKYQNVFHTEAYELIKVLEYFIDNYDIFHFHNSYSFIEDHRDIQMIKKAGKKMIMHHRGDDVRFRNLAAYGKGYINPYVNAENSLSDIQIHQNLELFADTMNAAIVQDYELYHYVIDYYKAKEKPVYVLPRLINTQAIRPSYPKRSTKCPIIVHAPTHRAFKGSDFIEAAIDQLKEETSLIYINIEGIAHKEALMHYKKADIIIDQILCGAYGNVTVEAMTLGKPVVCYIRSDLLKTYPQDLPIVSANPVDIYIKLKELILNPEKRHKLGKLGRKYVEKYHDGNQIIRQLITIYEEVIM